jgi:phosphoribosylformylglycinamidine synthase
MTRDVIVIQFPGVNCEYETTRALASVGLSSRIVRWNEKVDGLKDALAVVLPGGFAYQDRIRAGVVAAKDRIMDAVFETAVRGVPVLGICNGAQILVESGAVPGFEAGAIELALAPNKMPDRSGYYCTWVRVKKGPAGCIFTEFFATVKDDAGTIPIPLAHAEGRFTTSSDSVLRRLEANRGVALVYADDRGEAARSFPDNPNGSLLSIAGVTNQGGNVLALMPHPERAAWMHQVPRRVGGDWGRRRDRATAGEMFRPGPGRGFFESLQRGLRQ